MRSHAARFSRDNTIAFVRCFMLTMFATAALTVPGLGDDQKSDKEVTRGEVFCAWSTYYEIQVRTANCGLTRGPMDSAVDEAVAQLEEFILANFSAEITRPMLENIKRIVKASPLHDPARNEEICKGEAVDDTSGKRWPAGIAVLMRSGDPDRLRKEVKDLLSKPLGPPRPVPCR